ncbi:MAG: hypothetical protein HKN70_13975 [Gammaproteobacteria bacterium]|nr:hypothetical protein [Gammaproteobacteria bacterium]
MKTPVDALQYRRVHCIVLIMSDQNKEELRRTVRQIARGVGMFVGGLALVGLLGYLMYTLLGQLGQ